MSEETEECGYRSEDEPDDVQDEGVCDPLDDNLRNLDWEMIAHQSIDIELVTNLWFRAGRPVREFQTIS